MGDELKCSWLYNTIAPIFHFHSVPVADPGAGLVFEISFEISQTEPWFFRLENPFYYLFQCKFVWQIFKPVSPKQF